MTSNLRPKPDRRKKTISDAEAIAIATSRTPAISRTEIARKAFELFCARGGQHGRDLDDWLTAERELLSSSVQPRRRVRRTAALS